MRTPIGASVIASNGRIAPTVNATAEVPRGLERAGDRDLGDAELVAHVRAELVVRHELIGDEAREAGLDAAVLVDLRELVQLGPAVLGERLGLDRAGRPPRRRAAS